MFPVHSVRHTENSEHDEKIQAAGLFYLRESQSTCLKLSSLGFLYSHWGVLSQPSGLALRQGWSDREVTVQSPCPTWNSHSPFVTFSAWVMDNTRIQSAFFFFFKYKNILRVFRIKSCSTFQPHQAQSLFTYNLHAYSRQVPDTHSY